MHNFYIIFFYPIIYVLYPFSANHIPSCLGSRIDMVSNLDPVSIIFALSSITILPHQQNAYVAVQLMSIKTMMVSALGVPLWSPITVLLFTLAGVISTPHLSFIKLIDSQV